jgi:putative pyruvate formate lyase activating enzyme
MIQNNLYTAEEKEMLDNCRLCPRECGADRFSGSTGVCGIDASLNVASVCIHKGEEPVISGNSGICNIFFTGCNLRCIFCQNYEISSRVSTGKIQDLNDILDKIMDILSGGINTLGFVSPSHMAPQMKAIIRGINARGYRPVIVYNTNGYDKVDTLKSLAGEVDIYLPDYKYVTPAIARDYSGAINYPPIALKALKEMYFQKGSTLRLNENGQAEYGMVIRHLVLPGHAEESKKVLRSIAEELSPGVHISLMSQYHPVKGVADHPILNRALYAAEYDSVVEEMNNLGFRHGWIQEMDSFENYLPDFSREDPFES